VCGSIFHTAMYHKPKALLRRSVINNLESARAERGIKPKSRKKKTPRAIAKDKAWAAFSMYIRIRDSLATTGTTDFCVCITCAVRGHTKPKEFRHIQAGHAVGGRGNAVLFHEEITNGQCDYCNKQGKFGLSGDYGNYAIALIKRYGLEHTEELLRLKGKDKQYKIHDFIEIAAKYKQMTIDLIAQA